MGLVFLAAISIAPGLARAQEGGTLTGSESINSPVPNPNRLLLQNGAYVDVTGSPRPQNLNPTGVNFTDCEQDLELQFELVLSGFAPTDLAHVEVWAGTVDCTQDANRSAVNAGVAQPCWRVAGSTPPENATSPFAITYSVFARDVLRFEAPPQQGTNNTYDPTFHNSSTGETACHVQASDAAVAISVYFIPINSSNQAIGTAYQYPLSTDLVAPPAPSINSVAAGDTLLTVSWTSPGNDPDIAGFAIWSDPPAGGSTTGGCSCGATPGGGANSYIGDGAVALVDATMNRCIDAAAETGDDGAFEAGDDASDASDDTSTTDGGIEASMPEASVSDGAITDAVAGTDAGVPDSAVFVDAGMINCNPINVGGGGEGGACNSFALTGNVFIVGGTTTTTVDGGDASVVPIVTDDSGSDGGTVLTGGGIAEIPPQFKAGEIDDITATQITLTGLKNGTYYVAVVTSIDGSGNVGPPSTTGCGIPEPTNDFWGTYKSDGGAASGCALGGGTGAPVFAIGVGAVAAALARRRRR